MAGSYGHVTNGGWSLIENMGDAYQCVEELLWLVQREIGTHKAEQLLHDEFYPMMRREMPFDEAMRFVQQKMDS